MTVFRKHLAPPYALILLSEPGRGEVPKSLGNHAVAATDSCIAIGCRSEFDGETEILFGAVSEVVQGHDPIFSGYIATPGRSIAIQTVFNELIIEAKVPEDKTMVKIWINDPIEPDNIVIGLKL